MIVSLSYFHLRMGPTIFYSYPKGLLTEDLSTNLISLMDQHLHETYFIHSVGILTFLNFYFEVPSSLNPRGKKEMLMVSLICEQQIPTEIGQAIYNLLKDFSSKLEVNPDLYIIFHDQKSSHITQQSMELIASNTSLVKLWLRELYWAAFEIIREKSEIEKLAILVNQKHVSHSIKKLSKGPIALEEFESWFSTNFPERSFQELIEELTLEKMISINEIGRIQKYILLLMEINLERVPPEFIIDYFEERPELIDLVLPKIQSYFNDYEKKSPKELEDDNSILIQILADSKTYTVVSKLREGVIPKDQLPKLLSKKILESLLETIDYLKLHNVIEELKYDGESYVVLKTELKVSTRFPNFLKRLIPKEKSDKQ